MCHDLRNNMCNLIILFDHMNCKIGAKYSLTLAPHLQKAQSKVCLLLSPCFLFVFFNVKF